MLYFSTKLYLRVLGLSVTPDPKVIFIILIIILNLHDSSLTEFGCNIKEKKQKAKNKILKKRD